MRKPSGIRLLWCSLLLVLLISAAANPSTTPQQSMFDSELLRIRYDLAYDAFNEGGSLAGSDDFHPEDAAGASPVYERKSPAKAFLLSLAVPGLGQYYYGSRGVKPFLFLGAEAASWALHIKFHGEGDDITGECEAFNREHWRRDRYENYLDLVWGVTDDNDVPDSAYEVTHHLPDTRSQQYYEMTGKYDQFAWGWDDGRLDGNDLGDYSQSTPPPRIRDAESTPYSNNRLFYEGRRNDANNKYDMATRMVFVSLVNRLVSAFEAFFVTKSKNDRIKSRGLELSSVRLGAKLKSYYSRKDTPFITFVYKF